MRRARWKRKHVRRVGLRRRSPPAAGGGRLAVPCGSQRRKRAALGETSSPGRYRDTPLPLSPLPLTLPRRSRQRLAKRKARKEKLVECILAPRRCRHHPPRDSSHDLAEDDSVPEGKPKSALVPIRRPRQDRGANAPACAKSGLFFWTGRGPFSFRQDRKENGGRIAQPSSWLNPPGRQIAAPTPLSNVIQQMKRITSKQAGISLWQKGFYDHVIRNDEDLANVRQYIRNNPLKWIQDTD